MTPLKRQVTLAIVVLLVLGMFFPIFSAAQEKKKNLGPPMININTATEKELVTLKRIGMELAKRIVEYRKANGPFEKPEDIMKVKGVGQKIYEMNKDRLVVSNVSN